MSSDHVLIFVSDPGRRYQYPYDLRAAQETTGRGSANMHQLVSQGQPENENGINESEKFRAGRYLAQVHSSYLKSLRIREVSNLPKQWCIGISWPPANTTKKNLSRDLNRNIEERKAITSAHFPCCLSHSLIVKEQLGHLTLSHFSS